MKVLFNLLGLLCVMVASRQSGDEETEGLEPTLVEKAKKFLQDDEITLKIVKEFFKLKFNPELRTLMHLSLNQLLVSRQLLGHGRDNLQKMPEFPQLEYDKILHTLETSEKQEAFKQELEQISAEIACYINLPFETT